MQPTTLFSLSVELLVSFRSCVKVTQQTTAFERLHVAGHAGHDPADRIPVEEGHRETLDMFEQGHAQVVHGLEGEQLQALLADSPDDEFLKYALAMEWDSEGEHERSLALHRELIEGEPAYVPAFFMMGQQLARLQRLEEARGMPFQTILAARDPSDESMFKALCAWARERARHNN